MQQVNTLWKPLALVAALAALSTIGCVAQEGEAQDGDLEQTETVESALVGSSAEKAVASRLGLPQRFTVGLGNDVTSAEGWDPYRAHAYTLGPKVDIHYLYLSGLPGEGGWTEWNSPAGSYITLHGNAAKAKGVVPMFTLYQAAAWGENNLSAFNNWSYMNKYWRGVRTMFQRLNELGVPSIAHIEPDFWGYTQKRSDDPAAVPVQVTSHVPECADLPNNVAGFGKCIVRLSRRLSPKVVIGLQASDFGAYTNGVSDPARIGAYMNKVGGAEADITVIETLDRDAGCFEAAVDPNCKRAGTHYWTDAKFREHLTWAKAIRSATGKPLLWWQMPLGVASSTPGGAAGRYRDNRVQWMFSHAWEFAQAGAIGVVFGTGAGNQTTAKTDNGQFKNAVTRYLSVPTGLK